MALSVDPFDGDLTGLPEFLVAANENAADGGIRLLTDGAADLLGPFQVFVLDAESAAAGAWNAAEPRGWRGLLLQAQDEERAAVEFSRVEGANAFGLRDLEAAAAFSRALSLSSRISEPDEDHVVRFIAVPELHASAVWLAGDLQRFIPTRLGPGERPPPEPLDAENFRSRLVRLFEQAMEARAEPTQPGTEHSDDFSGLEPCSVPASGGSDRR